MNRVSFNQITLRTLIGLLFLSIIQSSFAQTAKKPTLMILPSDNWCTMRFFTTTYNNQGSKQKVPNYTQAFKEDSELGAVISKIGGLLTDYGYSLIDAEQKLNAIANRTAEDNVTTAKNSGAYLSESPLDQLKKQAKADILLQIWWKVNKIGSQKSVSFTLEAFDSYTSKRIATTSGNGEPSDDIIPIQLESIIKSSIPDFDKQMTSFYNDISTNGREIIINIKKWDNWEYDLESEFDGEDLISIIENWLHQNTVNGVFNLSDATENFMLLEQIRIPLFNEKGKAIDARNFVQGLRNHLKSKGIPSKLMIRGLGEANLILGEQ